MIECDEMFRVNKSDLSYENVQCLYLYNKYTCVVSLMLDCPWMKLMSPFGENVFCDANRECDELLCTVTLPSGPDLEIVKFSVHFKEKEQLLDITWFNEVHEIQLTQNGMSLFVTHLVIMFYPTALKGCWGIVFTRGVWMGGWGAGKVCPACISETVRCRELILGRDIG